MPQHGDCQDEIDGVIGEWQGMSVAPYGRTQFTVVHAHPLKVCAFTVAAFPVVVSVPPYIRSAEAALMRSVAGAAGAVVLEKFSVSVPFVGG